MELLKFNATCLATLTCMGCSSVKNQELSTAQQKRKLQLQMISKYLSVNEDSTSNSSLFLKHDSAGTEFTVEIWPSGPFDFSPYKGFEGTAQKIIYHGKTAQLFNTFQNQEQNGHSRSMEMNSIKTKLEESREEKQLNKTLEVKRSSSWKRWLLLSIGLLFAALAYKFLK
ncbi:hypothetical protein LPB86_01915 [Pedobacter sp. MC2016-14]|uniref:hypothetical protein n=1 Tax=Pedobacter sp. MC2016-14 TaxID=2897327 RepID=UPI001E30A08C|nr:hypothetical protein [Pedobacter sp. MC2016-14]MCD0486966.1 hypothetical protein [Pedobacter sp. MC2016-14]